MKRTACVAAACLALVACANRPESIHASYVSHERFMDLECPALAKLLEDTRADLANLSHAQNEKANADAAGVFLLGIPFSKLSGTGASVAWLSSCCLHGRSPIGGSAAIR